MVYTTERMTTACPLQAQLKTNNNEQQTTNKTTKNDARTKNTAAHIHTLYQTQLSLSYIHPR